MHTLIMEADNGAEILYRCPDCGRRVVIGKRKARMTVLDQGNFLAAHFSGGAVAAETSVS